jgi:hypothetical protein
LVAAAPALYVWYVASYGVNVPIQDTWNSNIPLLQALTIGRLSFAMLWSPHNEDRMLIPNLVLLVSDSVSHLNQKVDMYLSAAFLIGAAILLWWVLGRTTALRGLGYVPVAFLLFNLVQAQNALWGFQLAWMLIVFCLMAMLCLLELSPQRRLALIAACVVAIIASYSSSQGLLLWPAGLVYLVCLRAPLKRIVGWIAVAGVTTALYLIDFGPSLASPGPGYALHHLSTSLHFLLDLVGGIWPAHPGLIGVAMLATGPALALIARSLHVSWPAMRVPIALWLSAILFDLLVTEGRVSLGVPYALSSRYTTYNLILAISLYSASFIIFGARDGSSPEAGTHTRLIWVRTVPLAICVVALGLQLFWSIPNGLVTGRDYYGARSEAAQLLRNYKTTPVRKFGEYIYGPNGSIVARLAPVLARYHWSVFAK